MAADIYKLLKNNPFAEIETSIGTLVIYSLTVNSQAALKQSLKKPIDKSETKEFMKLFIRHTCYPSDSLDADNNMPDNPILSEKDAEMLSSDDLANIAHLYLIKNDYLFLESIRKTRKDEKGVTIVSFEKGNNRYPQNESESNLAYFHRLSGIEERAQDEANKELVKSIKQTLNGFSKTSIEQALAPTKAMADIIKASQAPLYLTGLEDISNAVRSQQRIAEIAKQMQPPEHLTALSQMMSAMQRDHRIIEVLSSPPRIIEDVAKQIVQMRVLSESITAPFQEFQKSMRAQSAIFENLSSCVAKMDAIKFSIPQFSQTTLAWNVSSFGLANRLNDIGLLVQRETLSARMLEASNAYALFVKDTTERLAAATSPNIAARLRGSLNLAEYQLIGISDAINSFVEMPEDNEEPDNVRILDAPYKQQDEILRGKFVQDENDTTALITVSLTAQTAQRGRRVLELVTQCNEAGKTSALSVEFFKPTTRLMTVFCDLPWLSATDRLRFYDVVDCLYFIFYEGAGKDNLRFLDKNGGPLTDLDCDFIWCVKHLRNKWSRHDADHGKEKDIKKSWAELTAKFRWLGLAEHPTEPHHFKLLHHQLLKLAEDFLLLILSKLTLEQ